MNKYSTVLEIQGPVLRSLLQKKIDLNLVHLTNQEFLEVIFIGGMYLLDKNNDQMVDFVLSNTSLDN